MAAFQVITEAQQPGTICFFSNKHLVSFFSISEEKS
jgi:hypothetical protein